MTRTSWSRCSKLVVGLLLVLTLAAPATAVTVGDTAVPEEGQVGEQVTATVTLTELYQNPTLERWQLSGRTALQDVTWVVEYYDQTGARVDQQEFSGQEFSGAQIAADEGTAEVVVRVTGTVPEVSEYSYDPPQQFLLMELTRGQQGGASSTVETWQSHHFTPDSDAARTAMDDAQAAIESASEAGASPTEAEESFASAVDAYESGNFDNAQSLAERAQREAQNAQSGAEQRRLLLFGGAAVVVLALLVGGVYYWRAQQDSYDQLA
ncbi:MAG: DUF4398 domain-containing protein [Haloferacaceae archaeon]|jgi:hypothetical protein